MGGTGKIRVNWGNKYDDLVEYAYENLTKFKGMYRPSYAHIFSWVIYIVQYVAYARESSLCVHKFPSFSYLWFNECFIVFNCWQWKHRGDINVDKDATLVSCCHIYDDFHLQSAKWWSSCKRANIWVMEFQ